MNDTDFDFDFLPVDYEPPKWGSKYTKFEDGKQTRLRILQKPLLGWVYWDKKGKDNKPVRLEYTEEAFKLAKQEASKNEKADDKKVNHFWALTIRNYETKQIEVWELIQKTIQANIRNYISDEEFGSPLRYDIKITKVKNWDKTTYEVSPWVPKDISQEIQKELEENPVNLRALLHSTDPFDNTWIEGFE